MSDSLEKMLTNFKMDHQDLEMEQVPTAAPPEGDPGLEVEPVNYEPQEQEQDLLTEEEEAVTLTGGKKKKKGSPGIIAVFLILILLLFADGFH